ncbi:MAG: DUF982 domain-containing protein [Rhizobiaceae bacterium]|nr:MAG: DUF982 domain-containing protein [Rhizobiaceae bacterium]CAG0998440.1 hypothetical protein RHIZO_02666 [Rhizobiaceae bacterium]
MDRYQFRLPVRLKPAPEVPVLELYDIGDALDFLLTMPEERRGAGFQPAVDACFAASMDRISSEDARWMLVRFAREAEVLSDDMRVAIDDRGEIVLLDGVAALRHR